MKILKKGRIKEELEEQNIRECEECGCLFSYDISDIVVKTTKTPMIWADYHHSVRATYFEDTNYILNCPYCLSEIIIRATSRRYTKSLYEE